MQLLTFQPPGDRPHRCLICLVHDFDVAILDLGKAWFASMLEICGAVKMIARITESFHGFADKGRLLC